MSLKIKGWRRIISWSIWAVLGLLFLIFLVRVATFEAWYYDDKEGSERAVVETDISAPDVEEEEELIEEQPTETEVHEYTVAPDRPRYLTIERLGIYKARILAVGINAKGEMDTPRNVYDVGWYQDSGKPGMGGTMVIDGHNGGPHVRGVFKNLPSLVIGDIIQVDRGDGAIYKFAVVENKTVLLSEADAYMNIAMRSPEAGKESLTLITCTGEWSQVQGTYLSRQFTRAILVD